MTTDFKPSQVVMYTPIPLVGTLGRCEREIAAALLVLACVHHGDVWQPIMPRMIGLALEAAIKEGRQPWKSLETNPFARPDFHDLIAAGYATGDLSVGGSAITLTDKTFTAITKWVNTKLEARA